MLFHQASGKDFVYVKANFCVCVCVCACVCVYLYVCIHDMSVCLRACVCLRYIFMRKQVVYQSTSPSLPSPSHYLSISMPLCLFVSLPLCSSTRLNKRSVTHFFVSEARYKRASARVALLFV